MRHFPLHKSTTIVVIPLVISLLGLTGFASTLGIERYLQGPAQVSPAHEGKIGGADLEAFADELVTRQLDEYHIAGAIVSIVQDGRVELVKGYGYANVEEQVPVTPDETLFRIGSTSKLFTWTAVMQLAEQGKIDLSADVNTYLPDFQIPATYPEPITMLSLMTHTSGFEDRFMGRKAHGPEDMISLHDYVANYMPDRVRPVGELTSYSNYGAALAGYIVEAVSGMPFERYIESYIFEPLSMSHSTFRQPLPPELEGQLAASYAYTGDFTPGTFTYVNPRPAAAMSSTAYDMASFMIAHLQEGRLGDDQILRPETARQMHTHLFSNDDRLYGFAYGFFDDQTDSILWHGGDIDYWHSYLVIFPEKDLGLFVAYNSAAGVQAAAEFVNSFIAAFSPPPGTNEQSPAEMPYHDLGDLAGSYRSTRSAYSHLDRIAHFTGEGYAQVTANPDRTLSIAVNGVQWGMYREKELLVYGSEAGDSLTFHQGADGKITHMQFLNDASVAYERIAWYESPTFTLLTFAGCTVLLVSALLAAFLGIFRRRKGTKPESRLPGIARAWAGFLCAAFILIYAAATYYGETDLAYQLPTYMVFVLALALAASLLVGGPVVFTVLAWTRRYWGVAGRVHYTLVTVALLGMVWLMYYWRLLGFRY